MMLIKPLIKSDTKNSFYSRAGYLIHTNNRSWQLDKNTIVYIGATASLLDASIRDSYIKTLSYYVINYSASHVNNINDRFSHFLRTTNSNQITSSTLINFRANLKKSTEWYLGTLRGFFRKWFEFGYEGITEEIINLLDSWVLKGNIKGDVIKRLDPEQGPLTDIELQGFNEGIIQAYEREEIDISSLALGLVLSNTGRRPIQISHLRIKDVLQSKNKRGETIYLLNVPRAKQRATGFREQFKQFAITQELWTILNAQVKHVINYVEQRLGMNLQEHDRLELPLFPDKQVLKTITSVKQLRDAQVSDQLHMRSLALTEACKYIAQTSGIYSERTGDLLNITAKRFRYTTGTRAAREGFGVMVIAELLDHSDNQNAGVYIENIPEHVERLDQAIGHQLAPYAQAFAGVLVDSEQNAVRGNDSRSRIRVGEAGVGTCGSYGFCGANVPIPCYTCMHFQPWLEGPHERVYDELIAERERLLSATGDMQIAAINDRSILAVANVIQRCAERREELGHGRDH